MLRGPRGSNGRTKERSAYIRASQFVLLTQHDVTKYYLGDQVKQNEIGSVCGMYGKEKCIEGLVGKRDGKRPFARTRHGREYKMYV
jgi:hypothetical protein